MTTPALSVSIVLDGVVASVSLTGDEQIASGRAIIASLLARVGRLRIVGPGAAEERPVVAAPSRRPEEITAEPAEPAEPEPAQAGPPTPRRRGAGRPAPPADGRPWTAAPRDRLSFAARLVDRLRVLESLGRFADWVSPKELIETVEVAGRKVRQNTSGRTEMRKALRRAFGDRPEAQGVTLNRRYRVRPIPGAARSETAESVVSLRVGEAVLDPVGARTIAEAFHRAEAPPKPTAAQRAAMKAPFSVPAQKPPVPGSDAKVAEAIAAGRVTRLPPSGSPEVRQMVRERRERENQP